jgi:GAF domain-containing protein
MGCHIELIAQASQLLGKTEHIEDALEIALQAISSIDHFVHIYFGLYDPQKKELVIRASYPRLQAIKGLRIPLSERTLTHAQSLVTAESLLKRVQQQHPGQSILDYDPLFQLTGSIPLMAQGQILGTVFVGTSGKKKLPPLEQEAIAVLINMTAATLASIGTHQRLTAEVQKQTAELVRRQQVSEGFRYILTILNSNRPLEEVLQYIISQACWLLDTTQGAAFQWHREKEKIEVIVSHGIPPQKYETLSVKAAQNALRLKQVAISSVSATQKRPTTKSEYATELAFPILVGEKAYGAICLYFAEQRNFSEEEINLMLTFSEQAALAIENDHLRKQAERQAFTVKNKPLLLEQYEAMIQHIFSASLLAEALPQLMKNNPELGTTKIEELRHLNKAALTEMQGFLTDINHTH